MITAKIYNSFKDVNGNEYGFTNYIDFATFWFNISSRAAKLMFPEYAALQKYASGSREARKPC